MCNSATVDMSRCEVHDTSVMCRCVSGICGKRKISFFSEKNFSFALYFICSLLVFRLFYSTSLLLFTCRYRSQDMVLSREEMTVG